LWTANPAKAPLICLNDGKGHFPACDALPTESATSIVAADLDGDGALDLFVPHRDGGQSIILWNDGKGHFPTSTKVGPAAAWIRMGAAGDFGGEGRLDLAFIDEQKQAAFVIYNRGRRQFGEPERLPGTPRPPYALAVTDLNHDGTHRRNRLTWQPVTTAIAADAIMLNPAETRQEMLGFGAAFTDAACYMLTGSHDVWPAVVDGRPDIVVGYVETPGTVYFNTGPHSFHEVPWNDGKGTVYGLAFADFNDRGRCSTLAPIRQLPGRRRPRMAFALRLTDRPR
jgi:hypothetical protein